MTDIRPIAGLVDASVADIRPHPDNPRERLTGIDDLAASMREVGLLQPIVCERVPGEPGLRVLAGHRRLAAVKHLGWTRVPVILRRDMLPDEALTAMLIENGQRAGLDPIEEARALRRLKDGGLTDANVAQKIGRHVSFVNRRLMLLTLPVAEQEEIRAGHFTVTDAETIVRNRRAQERRHIPNAGQIGRPKGAQTKPYFGDQHPLAMSARAACPHSKGKPKVGGVACGECWEQAIRDDERARITGQGATA